MMKNKCCVTCRIYEWGYMGTVIPLLFVLNFWTFCIIILAFIHILRWEILIWLHKERVSESTNLNLRCENCKEKLCQYRKDYFVLSKFLFGYDKNDSNIKR